MSNLSQYQSARVLVLPTCEDAVRQARAHLLASAATAVERRGRADLALGTGRTAELLYGSLGDPESRDALPWSAVNVWQTDEVFVPSSHPDSHSTRIRAALLGDGSTGVPVPPDNFHLFPVDHVIDGAGDPETCAQRYSETFVSLLQQEHRRPHLDLLVAEVSVEGTILSIFPESPAFDPIVGHIASVSPPPRTPRGPAHMTMTAKCFDLVPEILVLATGSQHAQAVGESLVSVRAPRLTPAQLLVRRSATWILDADAAACLDVDAIGPGIRVERRYPEKTLDRVVEQLSGLPS